MNGEGVTEKPVKLQSINTNTFISVGLFVTIVVGIITIMGAIYGARYDITRKQDLAEMNQNQLMKRMDKFEATKETWSFQDMYIWAGHLQRDNPTVKVPEPKNPSQ